MGPGVPYGIGAKFGQPDRPVIVFAGDGTMQMNGLAELITVKRYWEQWPDSRLIIAVLHNNGPQPGHVGDAGDGRGAANNTILGIEAQ